MVFITSYFTNYQQVEKYLINNRSAHRSIRVLFAGQVFKKMYNNLNLYFKDLINRNDLFTYIFKEFSNQIALGPEKQKLTSKQILISNLSQTNLKQKEWMDFLSRGYFFIAAPGFEMPFCHNLVEAMACGVIPILQHNLFFLPNLEHKKNCLAFNDFEQLKDCINIAMGMEEEELNSLKENVIEYYNNFLSPVSFTSRIEKSSEKNINFAVAAGRYSYEYR